MAHLLHTSMAPCGGAIALRCCVACVLQGGRGLTLEQRPDADAHTSALGTRYACRPQPHHARAATRIFDEGGWAGKSPNSVWKSTRLSRDMELPRCVLAWLAPRSFMRLDCVWCHSEARIPKFGHPRFLVARVDEILPRFSLVLRLDRVEIGRVNRTLDRRRERHLHRPRLEFRPVD